MALDSLKDGVTGILSTAKANPLASAGVIGAAVGAVGVGTALVVKAKKKRKTAKKKKRKTIKRRKTTKKYGRRRKTKRKTKRRYKYARTAGKGKDRSTRRIRMTKKGQPYIILKSGKARFIKRSSARRSRKLKGGRY